MAVTKGKRMLSAEVDADLLPDLEAVAREWTAALGRHVSRSEVVRAFLRLGTRNPDSALALYQEQRFEDARQQMEDAERLIREADLRLQAAAENTNPDAPRGAPGRWVRRGRDSNP